MSKSIPPVPGAVLRHKVLNRLKIRQADLARAMGISAVRMNQIVKGKAPITPEMALRLERATNTDAEYWLSLQINLYLHRERRRLARQLEGLQPLAGTRVIRIGSDRSALAQWTMENARAAEASRSE